MNSDEDPDIQSASTRAAGIAALRKIRRLVDEENAHDRITRVRQFEATNSVF